MDDRTIITELSNMILPVFIRKFNAMTLDEKTKLLKNPYLDELNDVIFSSLFLQVQNTTEVRELLNNKKVFNKVLTSPKNRKNRNILNIIGEENFSLLKYIFESDYIIDYKEQFVDYINSINNIKFKQILENINLTKLYHLFFKENTVEELENIIGISFINKDITSSFFQKTKMNILNPLGVLKIKNEKELLLYTKFGLLIEVLEEQPEITLKSGVVLPYQNILDVKEGKVNKLISLLKEKGEYLEEDLLEVSLKLYFIFGYDNARNIILDKFTNITPSSVNRIIDFIIYDYYKFNVLATIKAILSPILEILVMAIIIHVLNKDHKQPLTKSITTVSIAKIPLVISAILGYLTYISSNVRYITSPITALLNVISTVLMFFVVKEMFKEEENEKALKLFIKIEVIYYIVAFVFSFLGIAL